MDFFTNDGGIDSASPSVSDNTRYRAAFAA